MSLHLWHAPGEQPSGAVGSCRRGDPSHRTSLFRQQQTEVPEEGWGGGGTRPQKRGAARLPAGGARPAVVVMMSPRQQPATKNKQLASSRWGGGLASAGSTTSAAYQPRPPSASQQQQAGVLLGGDGGGDTHSRGLPGPSVVGRSSTRATTTNTSLVSFLVNDALLRCSSLRGCHALRFAPHDAAVVGRHQGGRGAARSPAAAAAGAAPTSARVVPSRVVVHARSAAKKADTV